MIVLVKEPGERAVVKEIGGGLRSMQKVVGGYIEVAGSFHLNLRDREGMTLLLICNEEGRLQGLPENAFGCVGTLFFCVAGAEDLEGFDDAEQAQLVADAINAGVLWDE